MENLWTRRSDSSRLSLSTSNTSVNGPSNANEAPPRTFTNGRRQDSISIGSRASFSVMSPGALASPTTGASSAFGLGSGAFASFGSAKPSKTTGVGGALDFGSAVGATTTKTPTTEKQVRELGFKSGKLAYAESKFSAQPTKHPLRHSWIFWFRPPQVKSNGYVEYEKTLRAMAMIDTAEDFFTIYQYLKRPSTLPLVSDYHIFKKGIRPIWEDEDNKQGGKWIVRLKKGVSDRYWEDLILAMIGDQFAEASEEVCGAVLSVRNGEDILSIWARNDGGRVLRIRETMKRVLAFPPDTKVEWKSHDSSIQQRGALDDARKEKSNNNNTHSYSQHNNHNSNARSTSRENYASMIAEKR